MQPRLTIITLGVADLKIAEAFYLGVLGWKRAETSNESITFLHLNGIYLSLYPRDKLAEDAEINAEGRGFKGFTLAYNARSEDEVDELFAHFEAHDVRIIKKPQKVFWGGYSGYISDPDDNLWEIAYNPFLEMDESGNVR